MEINYSENNHITLVGKVTSDKTFSHEIYGEKFYVFNLNVPRLSGNDDVILVTVSERLMVGGELPIGSKITVEGQFRSYNNYNNGKNKLVLTVFAKEYAGNNKLYNYVFKYINALRKELFFEYKIVGNNPKIEVT